MTRFFMVLVLAMAPLLAVCAKPAAGADEPLLIEGKRELYQRVLAVPGARMANEAGGEGHEAVTPFTAFYVYTRRTVDGTEWVELGTDRHGARAGWLPPGLAEVDTNAPPQQRHRARSTGWSLTLTATVSCSP